MEGDEVNCPLTANGERSLLNASSAAQSTMPLPSYARVTNLKNYKSIIVRVNDRGPYANHRRIDLSVKTAKLLGFYGPGLTKVKVEYVGRAPLAGSDETKLMASLRDHDQPDTSKPVMVASNKPFAPAYFASRPMPQALRPPAAPYPSAGAPAADASATAVVLVGVRHLTRPVALAQRRWGPGAAAGPCRGAACCGVGELQHT